MNESYERLMVRENQRSRVLVSVYKEYDSSFAALSESCWIDSDSIVKSCHGLDKHSVYKALAYLSAEGLLIRCTSNDVSFAITHKGLLLAEKLIKSNAGEFRQSNLSFLASDKEPSKEAIDKVVRQGLKDELWIALEEHE